MRYLCWHHLLIKSSKDKGSRMCWGPTGTFSEAFHFLVFAASLSDKKVLRSSCMKRVGILQDPLLFPTSWVTSQTNILWNMKLLLVSLHRNKDRRHNPQAGDNRDQPKGTSSIPTFLQQDVSVRCLSHYVCEDKNWSLERRLQTITKWLMMPVTGWKLKDRTSR